MMKAILTDETEEVTATRDMIAIVRFPPAVYGNGLGVYLFVKLKSPNVAIYRRVRYYHFPETPVEEEEFTGEFPYRGSGF
ncbi:MAG: hypothetical protein ACYTX0_17055 [Nostoc sp.]